MLTDLIPLMHIAVCDCCRRKVDYVRTSMWHEPDLICRECFMEWYDGDDPSISADLDNVSNKLRIGNWIRKKHGLPPLAD